MHCYCTKNSSIYRQNTQRNHMVNSKDHGVISKINHITNHHFVLTFRLLPFSKSRLYSSMQFYNLQFSYTQFFINIFYISILKGKQLSYKSISSHEWYILIYFVRCIYHSWELSDIYMLQNKLRSNLTEVAPTYKISILQ